MATKKQKEQAARAMMRAIHAIEAMQNTASVRACNVDQSRINAAKDAIHHVVQQLESGAYD